MRLSFAKARSISGSSVFAALLGSSGAVPGELSRLPLEALRPPPCLGTRHPERGKSSAIRGTLVLETVLGQPENWWDQLTPNNQVFRLLLCFGVWVLCGFTCSAQDEAVLPLPPVWGSSLLWNASRRMTFSDETEGPSSSISCLLQLLEGKSTRNEYKLVICSFHFNTLLPFLSLWELRVPRVMLLY